MSGRFILLCEEDIGAHRAFDTVQDAIDAADQRARDAQTDYIIFQPIKRIRATVVVEDIAPAPDRAPARRAYRRREKSTAPLAPPSITEPPPNTSVTGIASTGAAVSNAAPEPALTLQGEYPPPQQTPTEALVGQCDGEPEYDLADELPEFCDRRGSDLAAQTGYGTGRDM